MISEEKEVGILIGMKAIWHGGSEGVGQVTVEPDRSSVGQSHDRTYAQYQDVMMRQERSNGRDLLSDQKGFFQKQK